jgi:hypothetical protein
MSDKPVDYLRLATDIIDVYEFDKPEDLATAYAAMAQAEAMQRIAECLETIIDDMAQTKRTLREWQGEL